VNILSSNILWLVLGVSISVVFSTFLSIRMLTRLKATIENEIKRLESSLSILTSGSLGMGQKMLVLEDKLTKLQSSQEELKHSDLDFSFTQAQKLIAEGLDSEAIAVNSGLSSSEINLMRLLHKRKTDDTEKKPSYGEDDINAYVHG